MLDSRCTVWLIGLSLLVAGSVTHPAAGKSPHPDAVAANAQLGRGINLGNMLEAPREGAWGLRLKDEYFATIRAAGFSSVRIPIRWSAHAANAPPYAIDTEFFQRVDRAIDSALSEKLVVVINVHHYDDLYADPQEQRERFLALWSQIALRYQDQPAELFFEILNEPHDKLGAEQWNDLLVSSLAVIRKQHPHRMVIVGPAQWNSVKSLETLKLPAEDDRLIATFHYYLPFHFTHQGAGWAQGSQQWLGTTWTGTDEERAAIVSDLDGAAAWAARNGRPLYLGEFGTYSKADMASRQRWTAFVRSEAERRGMSWAYWEFAAGFGAYDPLRQAWRPSLLTALIPEQ